MLRYFFEKSKEDRSRLFDGLIIRNDKVFSEYQGRYPVIYLTFKDLKESSWKSMFRGMTNLLRREGVVDG